MTDSPAHFCKGHFGKVSLYCYDPTNDGTGEMVAVKALKEGCGPQLRSGWQREIEILRTLYHEHIVKYKGCCEDQGVHGDPQRCEQLKISTLGWRRELSWPDQLESLTLRGGVSGQPSQLGVFPMGCRMTGAPGTATGFHMGPYDMDLS